MSLQERPDKLSIIGTNKTLHKLISTWDVTYRIASQRKLVRKNDIMAVWAKVAMRRVSEVRQAWDALFENEICLPDGTVDSVALKFIAGQALADAPRPRPPARKGGA